MVKQGAKSYLRFIPIRSCSFFSEQAGQAYWTLCGVRRRSYEPSSATRRTEDTVSPQKSQRC